MLFLLLCVFHCISLAIPHMYMWSGIYQCCTPALHACLHGWVGAGGLGPLGQAGVGVAYCHGESPPNSAVCIHSILPRNNTEQNIILLLVPYIYS